MHGMELWGKDLALCSGNYNSHSWKKGDIDTAKNCCESFVIRCRSRKADTPNPTSMLSSKKQFICFTTLKNGRCNGLN